MPSLFKKPNFNQPNHHNGFDMSMRRLFTAPPGMLLPVYCDIANANDKYKLNTAAFIRTEAVNTAAFQNFKVHFDWFFVPFRQMYRYFSEFYNGVFDANDNFVKTSDKFALPYQTLNLSQQQVRGNDDYFDEATGQPLLDEFGVAKLCNALRLSDLLGYGTPNEGANEVPPPAEINYMYKIFPYKYLAYHKIFYSHYNKTDWQERDTYMFNVDSYHGSTIPLGVFEQIINTIHYRPYRHDYFTSIKPSPVFNTSFSSIVGDSYLRSAGAQPGSAFYVPESPWLQSVENGVTPGQPGDYPQLKPVDDENQPVLTANAIKSLFNFDKLCRITGLAGAHYTEQMRAHFGVDINNDIHDEAYFIGSQSVDLSISEVVATATTDAKGDGTTLGDIAGKGFGVSRDSKDLSYFCREQGVIMCIASIEPLQMYSSIGVERNGLYKEPFDFYRVEMDNLGMQPSSNSELIGPGKPASLDGYQYRYSELKTKVDIVNAGFWNGTRSPWQCNFQDSIHKNVANRAWRFYINPSYCDSIFRQAFLPDYAYDVNNSPYFPGEFASNEAMYLGDNFLCNVYFKVYKDSLMSVHSLPQLI